VFVEGGARATEGKTSVLTRVVICPTTTENPSRRSGWPKLLVCSKTDNEQDERLNSKERSNTDEEEERRRSLLVIQ
jgi:hypothetical protein